MKNITNTKFYRISYYFVCILTLVCVLVVLATTDIGKDGFEPFFESVFAVFGLILCTLFLKYINEVISWLYAVGVCIRAYFYDVTEHDVFSSRDCHEIYKHYHSMKSCFISVKHAVLSEIYSEDT